MKRSDCLVKYKLNCVINSRKSEIVQIGDEKINGM